MFFGHNLNEESVLNWENFSYEERFTLYLLRFVSMGGKSKRKDDFKYIFGKDFDELKENISLLSLENHSEISYQDVSIKESQLLLALAFAQHGLSLVLQNREWRKAFHSIANILGAYGYWLPLPQSDSLSGTLDFVDEDSYELPPHDEDIYAFVAE